MPHQCVHCSKILEVGSKEILEGCESCGGKFFFYIVSNLRKVSDEVDGLDAHYKSFSGRKWRSSLLLQKWDCISRVDEEKSFYVYIIHFHTHRDNFLKSTDFD